MKINKEYKVENKVKVRQIILFILHTFDILSKNTAKLNMLGPMHKPAVCASLGHPRLFLFDCIHSISITEIL
jgi:hypothetical protein